MTEEELEKKWRTFFFQAQKDDWEQIAELPDSTPELIGDKFYYSAFHKWKPGPEKGMPIGRENVNQDGPDYKLDLAHMLGGGDLQVVPIKTAGGSLAGLTLVPVNMPFSGSDQSPSQATPPAPAVSSTTRQAQLEPLPPSTRVIREEPQKTEDDVREAHYVGSIRKSRIDHHGYESEETLHEVDLARFEMDRRGLVK